MEKSTANKIVICLYIIIALLAVNTLVLIVANGSTESTDNKNQTEESAENTEYDVSMFDDITTDGLEDVVNSSDPQVIYIGRETCGYCVAFLPNLQQAQEEYGYKTKYIDISKASDEIREKLVSYDNEDKVVTNNYGSTPLILIVKDGKVVDGQVGYSEYDEFASFLEKNGISK